MRVRAPPDELLEGFLTEWQRLLDLVAEPSTVILVEGSRDRSALERLGLASPVLLVHRGERLPQLARSVAERYRRAIVLTDWDRTGGQLAQRLRLLLEADQVEIDLEVRRRIGRALRGELVHVEGLRAWAEHVAERAGTTWAVEVARRSGAPR